MMLVSGRVVGWTGVKPVLLVMEINGSLSDGGIVVIGRVSDVVGSCGLFALCSMVVARELVVVEREMGGWDEGSVVCAAGTRTPVEVLGR